MDATPSWWTEEINAWALNLIAQYREWKKARGEKCP